MKLKSLFFLSLIFAFFSCSNIYQNESNNTIIIPHQNKCVAVAKSEFSQSRYAIPTAFPSDIVYFATVSYDSSNFVKNESTNDTLSFALNLPPATDSYTLTVYAFPKDTTSITEDNKKSFIASGTSSSVEMEKGQQIADFGNIQLKINDSSTAKGMVELLIDNQSGGTLSISDTSLFTFDSTTNKLTSKNGGIDAGIYTVVFSAKDSSNKEIELENPVQIINVFAGIKTDKWFGDNVSDDNSKLTINKLTKTTFYVCGASPSFYGASTIDSTGSDTTGTGSLAKPFATISKAVSQCTDSTTNYTIYVDGTFEESSQIIIENKISIIGLKQKATIKYNNLSSNLFNIKTNVTFTISNLILDGLRSDNKKSAGIISILNSKFFVKNSIIKNFSSSNNGGAINSQGTLTIENSVIENCEASNNGGAIYSQGTLTIDENSVIGDENSTTTAISTNCSNKAKNGGGIYVADGKISCSGKVNYNYAENGGGIFHTSTDSLTINGGSVSYNGTPNENSKGIGGGICLDKGSLIISGTAEKSVSIKKNYGRTGGAIFIGNIANTSGVTSSATIKGNVDISYNSTSFTNNGGQAGAFFCKNGTLTIGESGETNSVKIHHNSTNGDGGAIMVGNKGEVILNAGEISSNEAGKDGGAVNIWGNSSTSSIFIMNGGIIRENKSLGINNGSGGAIMINNATGQQAIFNMTGGEISSNTIGEIQDTKGKAVYLIGGQINMSGTAYINSNNDIYLPNGKSIKITGNLSPTDSDGIEKDYTAVITPQYYNVNSSGTAVEPIQLLSESSNGLITENYSKFAVTSPDPAIEWYVTAKGKLNNKAPGDVLFATLNGVVPTDTTKVYVMDTKEEFETFADWINRGNALEGISFKLNSDITYTSSVAPIGYKQYSSTSGEKPFSGKFDGNNKTITVANYDTTNAGFVGLFAYIKDAEVKNLTLEGSINVTGYKDIGALVGKAVNSTIENITNNCSIVGHSGVGGIVCVLGDDSIIFNCVNNGTIECDIVAGGIVCDSYGIIHDVINNGNITITDDNTDDGNAGGIVARTHEYKEETNGYAGDYIYNCKNTGVIKTKTDCSVWAIAGIIGLCKTQFVYNCVNEGTVENNAPSDYSRYYVGGIIGQSNSFCKLILNCCNTGTIKSIPKYNVGGISGNSGDSTIAIAGNTGTLSSGEPKNVGAICGWPDGVNFKNCSWLSQTGNLYGQIATDVNTMSYGSQNSCSSVSTAQQIVDGLNSAKNNYSIPSEIASEITIPENFELKTWTLSNGKPTLDISW